MARGYEVQGVTGDFDVEFPYVLFDYYMDLVEAGEVDKTEAMKMFLTDMAINEGNDEQRGQSAPSSETV